MPYRMHRIFCATSLDAEEERLAFYDILAEFNEQEAMPRSVLFVPVSLIPAMSDKRLYQRAVEENIFDSRYYVLVWDGSWGPPQRNLERDWQVALECAADPQSSVLEAVMLSKGSDFGTSNEFRTALWSRLQNWLTALESPEAQQLLNR